MGEKLKHSALPAHLMSMKARFQKPMTLQDVVKIVSQFSRNDHETAVVVADLLNRFAMMRQMMMQLGQSTGLLGKIPGFKVGGSWRFERREIDNWIKRKVEDQQGGNLGA